MKRSRKMKGGNRGGGKGGRQEEMIEKKEGKRETETREEETDRRNGAKNHNHMLSFVVSCNLYSCVASRGSIQTVTALMATFSLGRSLTCAKFLIGIGIALKSGGFISCSSDMRWRPGIL